MSTDKNNSRKWVYIFSETRFRKFWMKTQEGYIWFQIIYFFKCYYHQCHKWTFKKKKNLLDEKDIYPYLHRKMFGGHMSDIYPSRIFGSGHWHIRGQICVFKKIQIHIISCVFYVYTGCFSQECSIFCDFARTGLPLVIKKMGQPIRLTVHSSPIPALTALFVKADPYGNFMKSWLYCGFLGSNTTFCHMV